MANLVIRLDMRAPDFGAVPEDLYAAALDMADWADAQGFAECMLSEHHGSEDGFLPSPLVLGSAIAARTRRMRIQVSALILALHDPLRIAEDVAVLDNISGGRIELVLAGGFLPQEFEMFGFDMKERGKRVEKGIAVLDQAWSGEPFEYRGAQVRVAPRPVQRPRPPLYLGGSSAAAARRAARLADGFVPAMPDLYAPYLEECAALGREPGPVRTVGSFCLFVSEDPARTWAQIAPHAMHESNGFARWYAQGGTLGPYQNCSSIEELQASGMYQVLTPEEVIGLAEQMGPEVWLYLHPLLGGLDPAVGWESLELLASKVIPHLP